MGSMSNKSFVTITTLRSEMSLCTACFVRCGKQKQHQLAPHPHAFSLSFSLVAPSLNKNYVLRTLSLLQREYRYKIASLANFDGRRVLVCRLRLSAHA